MSEIFDWASTARMHPEPITVEIWRQLPEEFCRQVEGLRRILFFSFCFSLFFLPEAAGGAVLSLSSTGAGRVGSTAR